MFMSATNSGCGLHGMCIAEITSHASIVSVAPLVTLSIISPALLRSENVQLSWISSFQIQTLMNMTINCHLGCGTVQYGSRKVSTFQRNLLGKADGEGYSDDLELSSY
jgi:hypothetical protein